MAEAFWFIQRNSRAASPQQTGSLGRAAKLFDQRRIYLSHLPARSLENLEPDAGMARLPPIEQLADDRIGDRRQRADCDAPGWLARLAAISNWNCSASDSSALTCGKSRSPTSDSCTPRPRSARGLARKRAGYGFGVLGTVILNGTSSTTKLSTDLPMRRAARQRACTSAALAALSNMRALAGL